MNAADPKVVQALQQATLLELFALSTLIVAAHTNPPLSDREDAVPGSHRVASTAGGGTLHWVVDSLTG